MTEVALPRRFTVQDGHGRVLGYINPTKGSGDHVFGVFPTYEMAQALADALQGTVREINVKATIDGLMQNGMDGAPIN